ncbi:MAG: hypothetical protein EOP90_11100 [Lysobacteraceae bacterium]|nr:MAG: hypothetical protein EOP90_11100 [Xanthomonadaceae bacterium]
MSRIPRAACALFFLAQAAAAPAQQVVYEDALGPGFEDWSYGGGSDFANTTPVHAGTYSIALSGNAYNAVSFHHASGGLSATTWPTLKLWVHGGSGGGQQLQLILQNEGEVVAQAALSAYLAGGPSAATWREATVMLAQPPLSWSGAFDRIDIQSDAAATQPTVYLDDIALFGAGGDAIFADGFEGDGPPPPGGLVIERDVAIDGLTGDRFGWRDATGRPRVAVLAHNDGGAGNGGSRGGELREFRYEAGGATRVVRATTDGFGGFGYVVSHAGDESHCTGGGDSSSLGHFTGGSFERVFEGRHHAILRFTQAYPRYCTTAAPAQQYNLPVTIDWVVSSGRDDPLWSITYDLSGVPVDRLADDSRAPYGQLRIDGAASDATRAQIAGVAWGDYYRFASTTSPVTLGSAWNWNQANTIPFVKLWTGSVDATMGLVQTQTIAQQDAGGYWGQDLWMTSSATTSGCPGNYLMPCDYNWPYQSINYNLYGGATQDARLAWGTNFGFLGQQQYRVRGNAWYGGGAFALPGDPVAPGWPKKSYSLWIVLGTHSSDPVGARVAEVDALQSLALTATIGAVATQGPAGVADATPYTYAPAGWDRVRGALTFDASTNRLDANIAIGTGTLRHPLLVVRGWSAGLPATLKLGGATLVQDVDYFPSPRAAAGELWITLNRDLAGAVNRIEIQP